MIGNLIGTVASRHRKEKLFGTIKTNSTNPNYIRDVVRANSGEVYLSYSHDYVELDSRYILEDDNFIEWSISNLDGSTTNRHYITTWVAISASTNYLYMDVVGGVLRLQFSNNSEFKRLTSTYSYSNWSVSDVFKLYRNSSNNNYEFYVNDVLYGTLSYLSGDSKIQIDNFGAWTIMALAQPANDVILSMVSLSGSKFNFNEPKTNNPVVATG